ncbi:MAG: hypothetical protein ACLP1X_07785 [Polyangiaceae bacterium]|jgi:hypothetical protein
MKATIAGLGSLVLLASFGGTALAQEQIAPPYQDAPVAMQAPPVQAAPLPPMGAAYAPAPSVGYPYVTYVGGAPYPYPYLYAPRYGWSAYAPAWGAGRYRYGARVAYPGHAVGWRGGRGGHPHVAAHVGGGHAHRR